MMLADNRGERFQGKAEGLCETPGGCGAIRS
jgi:hypothetical protein